jgi:hypothetical protein
MRLAVILPSRGLTFSQTADELLQNLQGWPYDIFFAHGLNIPECFETPLTKALRGSYTHIWFVEDDMILPPDTLGKMVDADVPVATFDYPVSKEGQGVVFKSKEGRILFTGTGCMLVKREVFKKLNRPFFRTDIHWNAVNHPDFIRFTANKVDNPTIVGYGLHDVTFGMKLYQVGIPISVIGMTGQRKLIALGKPGTNDGAHQIEEWTKIKPDFMYKKLRKNSPQPTGKLVTVMTLDGELAVHPDKAKKLIKAGVATKIPKQSVVVDYNEVNL